MCPFGLYHTLTSSTFDDKNIKMGYACHPLYENNFLEQENLCLSIPLLEFPFFNYFLKQINAKHKHYNQDIIELAP